MEYREYKPGKLLSAFVECYWTACADKPPFREHESLIPDGTIELLFNFGDNYSQIVDGGRRVVKGSHVIGIRKESLRISQTDNQDLFSVRFKLGGIYPFLRMPVHTFANDFFELDLLMGNEYKELEERLFDAASDDARIAIMERYLLKKLSAGDLRDYDFVDTGLKFLIREPTPDIKLLAERSNASYKTLERKFERVIGLTPSEVLKIRRFNNAVLLMYSCNYGSLTEIAYDCGYFDQSHFIREFKQLTAFTPREFLQEQFTIVQVIQPTLAGRMSKSYNL
ncbi:MAG TPA: helix-turn-helix domain-containing protein [Candidatus Kryptobacter bacterium]|nr:helix-turn-helix domain-containing protein [Candidatus Kryptobacter bacterium]